MTLMELTVGIAIIALVAVTAGSMFVAGMRSFQARHVGNVVMADLRFAMEVVASDLRAAMGPRLPTINNDGHISFMLPNDPAVWHYFLQGGVIFRGRGTSRAEESSPVASNVHSLGFVLDEHSPIIDITMVSITAVDGVTGSGLPLTLTTRVRRRNP